MVDIDLVRSKISNMQRNIDRLKEKSSLPWEQFQNNLDAQDIILHNLQLAIQICLDIGNHIIADESWEVPSSLGNIFQILSRHKAISPDMADTMAFMAGFRNILIHKYEEIDLKKVYDILTHRLNDFEDFSREIIKYLHL
ncbi:DUF86 domain-containing protein [candidate division NPL-UPA2 bacterium]|nr:DUF86 domain-containing protein [candidate division NPL-UPA2 bacterium]